VICRHLGATDEQGVIAALHACDVHLTMTREDNLPNTVVEALACGLPVVGTRTGGLPEMVRDGVEGWLVPCDDAAGAAGVLGRLAHEGGLVAGAARAARERAELAFDARLQARRHIELFHSLLERPTPVPSRPSPAGLRVIRMTPGVVPLLSHARIIRQTLRRMRRGLAGGRAATPGLPDSPKSPKP
jgi:hypothetical protein